jgi:N-acetylglutamate synthase-like GNAT family acetyltransferase
VNIHIREAELGDAASIVRLIAELAETGGDHSPLTGGYVADFLTFPGSHVLLAEEEGQVVGCSAIPSAQTCTMRAMYA